MSGLKDHFYGDDLAPPYVPPFQPHSTTSREAAHSIAPRVTALQQRVIDYLKSNPEGATDEMLIDALCLNASTLRPRRIELVALGLVKDSGHYAICRSGRRATVWRLTPQFDPATFATAPPL